MIRKRKVPLASNKVQPQRTKQNGNQLLQIPGTPSCGWEEGADAGWKGACLWGLAEKTSASHAASCFSLQPELLSFQQNSCIAPGHMTSSPSRHPRGQVVQAPGTFALERKCISFFIGLLLYIFSCWMISQLLTLTEEIWVGDKITWKRFEAGDSWE